MDKKKKNISSYDELKRKITDHIAYSYFYYKVCEGCESVILHHHVFCPVCDGYNFDMSYRRIKQRVKELINHDDETIANMIQYLDAEPY